MQSIGQLEEKVRLAAAEHEALQADLSDLRRQASQISEINDIVNLKMRLNSLQSAFAAKERQAERLRRLIDRGRQIEDPEGIDDRRLELSAALTEAAKVTAIADRLAKRQQDAARQTFLRKISVVQELDESNPEDLAREVLQLRKQRRELENRLGITPADGRNDDF